MVQNNLKILLLLSLFFLIRIPADSDISAETVKLKGLWDYSLIHSDCIRETESGKKMLLLTGFCRPEYKGSMKIPGAVPSDPAAEDSAVLLSTEFSLNLNKEKSPLTLSLGRLSDVSAVFLNEVYIGGFGSLKPYRSGLYYFFIKDIPEEILLRGEKNRLTVALSSPAGLPLEIVSEEGLPEAGDSYEVYRNYHYTEMSKLILLAFYTAAGIYHLFLFVRKPDTLHNIFFAGFTFLVSVHWFFNSNLRDTVFPENTLLRVIIQYGSLHASLPFLVLLTEHLFLKKITVRGLLFILPALTGILWCFTGSLRTIPFSLFLFIVTVIPAFLYTLWILISEARKRNPDAFPMLTGTGVMFVSGLYDFAADQGIISSGKISDFTFPFYILGIAVTFANSFVSLHSQLRRLNSGLEQMVDRRTRELSATLNEVRQLKEQQDGDYYLTSLLLKPLSENRVSGDLFEVNILTRQKKKFRFRKWDVEIGGDLSSAHRVTLKNKPFIVFINSDAMGKSVQGAGGALVSGTVFKALISRTQMSRHFSDIRPEQWLKKAFLELQQVMESFEGSMMISAIIGALDESTGTLYWIHCDHPEPVLLSPEGKAQFMKSRKMTAKIGISDAGRNLAVSVRRLEPGETVIFGSDGRDDIQTSLDDNGERIISSDETLFLKSVEAARGNASEILKETEKKGTLTDDFSLITIHSRQDPASVHDLRMHLREISAEKTLRKAHEAEAAGLIEEAVAGLEQSVRLDRHSRPILKKLIRLLEKSRQTEKALKTALFYTDKYPEDSGFLKVIASMYKRNQDTDAALDYAECARLRDPDDQEIIKFTEQLKRLNAAASSARDAA